MQQGLAHNLKALAEEGVFSTQVFAGGGKNLPTTQPTVSGPGWATLLTGVWQNKHGITNNSFAGSKLAAFPHFMRHLKEAKPGAWCGSVSSWPPINDIIVHDSQQGGTPFADELFSARSDPALHERDAPEMDIAVRDAALGCLRTHDPDVLFVHLGQVDEYGHGAVDSRAAFTPDSRLYLNGIALVDSHAGELIRAVRARPRYKDEHWLIIVTTDHGGKGNSHGGTSDAESNIWLIATGGDVPAAALTTRPIGQTIVPHLIFHHLGLPVNPAWNWEPAILTAP
jgi:predicted AlkP superfamily pyrophosphatase or phosphodiesterase